MTRTSYLPGANVTRPTPSYRTVKKVVNALANERGVVENPVENVDAHGRRSDDNQMYFAFMRDDLGVDEIPFEGGRLRTHRVFGSNAIVGDYVVNVVGLKEGLDEDDRPTFERAAVSVTPIDEYNGPTANKERIEADV